MAHFAQIDSNNKVLQVLVVGDADAVNGQDFLANQLGLGGMWIQTSYNTYGGVHYGSDSKPDGGVPLRKNYAGIGFTYDPVLDAFYSPQPYPSWTLNTTTCLWEAPVSYPSDGKVYVWDESSQSWKLSS